MYIRSRCILASGNVIRRLCYLVALVPSEIEKDPEGARRMSIAQPGGIAPTASSCHTVALLASGGFLLLAGALFATPFLLNTRSQENDVFLANLFLAPLISLVGSLLYLVALRRLGLSILPLLALLVLNVAALTGWLWIPVSIPQRFALIAALLAGDMPITISDRRR
jgi:drug/metabolite transporter (DMT)-like permease